MINRPDQGKAKTMTDKTRQDMANEAADMVARMLADFQAITGYPPECIAAGAHGQIVATVTLLLGGPQAAVMFRQAAERVENLPSLHAASLAMRPPAGRA
ncbi:hypothetical protein SAMN05421774_101808 [Gemmobacter megaterium]|uniref:Uncharacterized protein n=1 Tax=Gemmobacter megaterium TaxID=1086013 RepID=A0A1N7L028_9RHOB|nr:hypothetical protein [Gemmobacter megaterium]GGE04843.1 hypothetical protein GCM10011345_07910 [Gemmobacter megaterium]SIS67219.1 hypothetical protein SAMN05421774_101808 [Gemmobacter megaterium]